MATTLFDLQEQRMKNVADMRGMIDAAEKEGKEFTAEDDAKYSQLEKDLEELDERIQQQHAKDQRIERLKQAEEANREVRNRTPHRRDLGRPVGGDGTHSKPHYLKDVAAALSVRGPDRTAALEALNNLLSQDEQAAKRYDEFATFLSSGGFESGQALREYSAMQMDSDTAGGAMVAPEVFLSRLIQGLDEQMFMRQISTVLPPVAGHSVGIGAEGDDPADSDWTGAELSAGTLDTTMTVSKRRLRPRDLRKRILVSKKLTAYSAAAVQHVESRLRFKHMITQEKGFLTGSGAQQPLGVFTASDDGISTSRDVSTDNTDTAITADGLINCQYTLASQYLQSANLRWLFHRTAVRNIRKLKDGNGQYLWQPGLGGQPSSILDTPYFMSEFAPSTFTTGLYVGLIGDFSYYYIIDGLRMSFEVLRELHAATDQNGFYVASEHDGMPVLEEAFARVTLA